MSEWQLIDTAPQDGRWFLAIDRASNVPNVVRPIGPRSDIFECFWYDGFFNPTHWLPLPAPPSDFQPIGDVVGRIVARVSGGE